ncbi:MAG TPA: helicase-associated domain-containing protein, partial [Actinomycetospora sp.]|nr:helicase-associated domain-containing protein [Actinomycetospora sp.]
ASSPARTAVQWLLRHGLLAMSDTQHAVLPREIGLALREGRTHREPVLPPAHAPATPDPAAVDADGARHAEELVRLVTALVRAWGEQPVSQVRSGGVGVRELRRLAVRLGVADQDAAVVVEVAEAAGIVADDGAEQPSLVPTGDADAWLAASLGARWQALGRAWLGSDRATWLVGSRDEGGTARGALDPELRRPWVPRLRAAPLEVLAASGALTAEQVIEVLRWRSPRTPPAVHGVEAVLAEATLLGVVGAGALTSAGRVLLDGGDAATALEAQLPPTVGEVLLQGDLTGVVPGRPDPDLAELLDLACDVESRGAALTVRFTEASVRRALDSGTTAEQLLDRLARHARTGVPQPLEYLVADVGRRHGLLRVGTATSYVRAEDPALLAGLVGDRTLGSLHLVQLAPTVLAAQVPAPVLAEALRDRGLAPVVEGPDGQVVVAGRAPHRIRPRRGRRAPEVPADDATEARERRVRRLAADILAADRRRSDGDDEPDPDDAGAPSLALGLLREAAEEHRPVWLQLVGPDGTTSRRRVRPLRVDAGRVRVLDLDREAELTVAVHRIVDVSPARGAS